MRRRQMMALLIRFIYIYIFLAQLSKSITVKLHTVSFQPIDHFETEADNSGGSAQSCSPPLPEAILVQKSFSESCAMFQKIHLGKVTH